MKSYNPVRHGGNFHIVGNEEYCLVETRCKSLEVVQNLVTGFGVKVTCGFVSKQDCRLLHGELYLHTGQRIHNGY